MSPAAAQKLLAAAMDLHRSGRLDEALASYRKLIGAAPRNFDAVHLAGMVLLQQGRAAAAVELLERAHKLAPGQAVCAMRLAMGHSALGGHERAEAILRRLLSKSPNWHEAWDNLGCVLELRGRQAEAIDCHRRAVALKPAFAAGWCNLGLALLFADKAGEALDYLDRAREIDPAHARAEHGRGMALQHLHRIPEAVEAYGRAIAKAPGAFDTRSYRLMALHYLDGISREEIFAEHRAYGAAVDQASGGAGRAAPAIPTGSPDRRLRVAFLSPDLRRHSVAYFIEPLLRHLDRDRFEILLYHDHFVVDEISERLRALASVWRNLVGLPGAEAENLIRSDAPDVLVDLAGHTGLNRLPLLARRLSPVQVTYLGYPDTSGLAAMDYRLVDAITDPPGDSDRRCTEKLVRFAPTAWSYAPPESPPLPARREEGPIRFGSFNNLAKVGGETLRAWSSLLALVPGSVLVLKAGGLGGEGVALWMNNRLRAAGIDPARVEFHGRTPGTAEHLAAYHRVDVALDTFPYNGTTTTCEALWMGVPVVTLAGDRHASRVGASLLAAIGRPEWVARTWEEYAAIAADLARSRFCGGTNAGALRAALAGSPLMDHAGQGARFGNALRGCWTAATGARERAVA